jgi:hypothetical protein
MYRWLLAPVLTVTLASCDLSNDDDDDHDVPDGQGSLIVDNNSADEISVFVDGIKVKNLGDYSDWAYDLDPGVHRVVLDQSGGDRSYREDIDILKGRRTVLDVSVHTFDSEYDVAVFFD